MQDLNYSNPNFQKYSYFGFVLFPQHFTKKGFVLSKTVLSGQIIAKQLGIISITCLLMKTNLNTK